MTLLRRHFLAVAFVLSIALLCSQVSFRIRFDTLDFMLKADMKVLAGEALYPEFQNRILSPLLLSFCRWLLPESIADRSVWYLVRFLAAGAGFLALYVVVLASSASRLRALVAVVLVAYAYLWTPMTHPWEYTSDFFDIMFTALMVHFILAEGWIALLPLVVLAAANRESATFAGLLWIAVTAMRYGVNPARWARFLPGVVFIAIAFATVYGLRYGLSRQFNPYQHLGIITFFKHLHVLLHPTGILPMVFACLLVFGFALIRIPRPWTADQRGLLMAALACAGIGGIFGIAAELRVFLPTWTILSILIAGGRDISDDRWLATLLRRRTASA